MAGERVSKICGSRLLRRVFGMVLSHLLIQGGVVTSFSANIGPMACVVDSCKQIASRPVLSFSQGQKVPGRFGADFAYRPRSPGLGGVQCLVYMVFGLMRIV